VGGAGAAIGGSAQRGSTAPLTPSRGFERLLGQMRPGRKPAHSTAVNRDYEALRIDMQILFDDLAVTTEAA